MASAQWVLTKPSTRWSPGAITGDEIRCENTEGPSFGVGPRPVAAGAGPLYMAVALRASRDTSRRPCGPWATRRQCRNGAGQSGVRKPRNNRTPSRQVDEYDFLAAARRRKRRREAKSKLSRFVRGLPDNRPSM